MRRKLYALVILLWTTWVIVLTYLYFFVYYTATLTVNSNVWGYRVEFFSKSTAQKRIEECPKMECVIQDLAPFEYNVSIFKPDYESQNLSIQVIARRSEALFIDLQKKAKLSKIIPIDIEESPEEQIQRIRTENRSYARFELREDVFLTFKEQGTRLEMFFETSWNSQLISDFQTVWKSEILADNILDSDSIFLTLGNDSYIFDTRQWKLIQLDFQIKIYYIKAGSSAWEYLIITEKWAFLYESNSWKSEFQYLFQDYVFLDEQLIWVIFEQEEQKRKNFNLQEETWNLIIKYNPQDKTRKILYTTDQKIERIEKQKNTIILTVWGEKFELNNY